MHYDIEGGQYSKFGPGKGPQYSFLTAIRVSKGHSVLKLFFALGTT